jgi:hypothetical protein
MRYALFVLFSLTAWASPQDHILNWQPTEGMTEARAAQLAREGIAAAVAVGDQRETCTADEFWGFEYAAANTPGKGPAFAIEGYARGPVEDCVRYETYDCRVVFNHVDGEWRESYTDCEPNSGGRDD